MFVQVKYQLRSRGRSVLVLCIAALLAACMAFYVGNIGVTRLRCKAFRIPCR